MRSAIAKWGNSLAVRLPKRLAEAAALYEGKRVELRLEDGALVIQPARPKYRLDELLAGLEPGGAQGETDWGPPQGREAW